MKYLDPEIVKIVRSVFRFNNYCNTDMSFQKISYDHTYYIHIKFFALVRSKNRLIALSQYSSFIMLENNLL